MIIVDYNDIGIKRGLWQYDFGQVLRIQGGNLKSAVEIHFSLQETGGEAVTRIGTTKDGVTDVVIPDTMLINDDIDDKYNIYVFIYIADRESGKTEKKFALEVKSRPKPEAFDATEDKKLFEEAIKAVNESAERAETAEQQVVEDFATLVKDSEPIYGNPGEKYFSVKADGATLNYDYSKVYSEVGVYKKDVQRLYVPKVMASSFIVGVNDTDTIETAKAHMHYKVIYETDAEEFVPLPQETQTALNALHTYYPTTVMGNSEDCEMEVEYVADTKNYIDNKISANVASIISQYQTNVANLLSLMPLSVQAGMVENDTNNILENVEEMKHE